MKSDTEAARVIRASGRALFSSIPSIRDEPAATVVLGDGMAPSFVTRSGTGYLRLALPKSTFLTIRQELIRTDDSTFGGGMGPCKP